MKNLKIFVFFSLQILQWCSSSAAFPQRQPPQSAQRPLLHHQQQRWRRRRRPPPPPPPEDTHQVLRALRLLRRRGRRGRSLRRWRWKARSVVLRSVGGAGLALRHAEERSSRKELCIASHPIQVNCFEVLISMPKYGVVLLLLFRQTTTKPYTGTVNRTFSLRPPQPTPNKQRPTRYWSEQFSASCASLSKQQIKLQEVRQRVSGS